MSRRVSLPGADELFRSTREPAPPAATQPAEAPAAEAQAVESPAAEPQAADLQAAEPPAVEAQGAAPRQGAEPQQAGRAKASSGRVRHDEKITVYVTADELHDLESTRLALRRDHGLAVDRGRIVRAAITLALEAVEAEGEDSLVVRRLRSQ